MFIRHIRFQFETDAPRRSELLDKLKRFSEYPKDPFNMLYGEAQFAAVEGMPVGPDAGQFPRLQRVEEFPAAVCDKWHRKSCGHRPEKPVYIETIAKTLHAEAVDFMRLCPLVAVHAIRLSWLEDFSEAVTYLSCAVPLIVVHGQIVPRKPRPEGEGIAS